MSGICASLDLEGHVVDLERLRTAALSAAYRGPDGIAYMTLVDVGLAHLAQRSTPEAAGETQPTLSDDRRLSVVADVRLDHRQILADSLRTAGTLRAGHPGDAQLILAAYERWVEECPAHLDGDFAFVLWDGRKRQLFCARDRHGGRPLHFAQLGTTLWVGSDPRQLLALPEAPSQVDLLWLAAYLVDLPRDAQRTPFHHLRQLPPGWRVIAQSSGIDVDRVPSPTTGSTPPATDDRGSAAPPAADEFSEALDHAVRSCLHTSSPAVGLLLGDDRAGDLLATVCGRLNAESTSPVELLAVLHSPRELPDGITGLAAAPTEAVADIPIDSPVASWEATAVTQLRSLADQGVTILLTTLGWNSDHAAPPPQAALPAWLEPQFLSATGIEEAVAVPRSVGDPVNTLPWPLATTSLHRALAWAERTAAEHGIELRHPFLDRRMEAVPYAPADRPLTRPVAHVPPAAIVAARDTLAGTTGADEPLIVSLGLCHSTRFRRALANAENATGSERDALWRALALERWLQTHSLTIAW